MIQKDLNKIFLIITSFISGIIWQKNCNNNFLLIFIILSMLITCLIFFLRKLDLEKLQILCYFLFFFSGAILYQNKINNFNSLANKYTSKKLSLVTQVDSIENNSLLLHVYYLKDKYSWDYEKVNFKILIYSQNIPDLKTGQFIKIKNIFLNSPDQKNGLSENTSFYEFLIKENILTSLFLKDIKYKIINCRRFSLKYWLINKKEYIYNSLKNKFNPLTFSFFSTIFLGHKKEINSNNLKYSCEYWGISHFLARAGLHIILFVFLWQLLLKFLTINIYIKNFILLFICIIYDILTWSSLSFIRAYYIFIAIQAGKLFDKQINYKHILSLLCLLILLFNPIQIFFLDFQLSFALTFGLAYLIEKKDFLEKIK